MDFASLQKLTPNFDWTAYLRIYGINKLDTVIVGQPEFFTTLNAELTKTPIEDWKNYLRAQVIRRSAYYLDSTTFNNYFEYEKSLSGATEKRARWKNVLDAEEDAMGEALGQLFVKEYFNEKAKKRYTDLVEAIRDAYRDRIKNLSWMTDSTKQKTTATKTKVKAN